MSTPKDIIERETWSCDDHWLEVPDGERTKSVSIAETPIHMGYCLHHNSTDDARAQVAACAPEALKLLLSMEWVSSEDAYGQGHGPAECASCEVTKYNGVHKDDCAWLKLMQKAGLR